MTNIASVGAVLGCLSGERALQYVPAASDPTKTIKQPLNPIQIEIEWV